MRKEKAKVDDGEIKILFTFGEDPMPELNGVPSIYQLIKDPDDREVYTLIRSGSELGRPIMTPPGVPADRLAALRQAFEMAMKDNDFLAEAARQQLNVTVRTGPQLEAFVAHIYDTPQVVIEKARGYMPSGK
jgi:hypothetical protein